MTQRTVIRAAKNLFKSRVIVVLTLSVLLLTASLLLTHRTRPYNSDDVSWQNIVRTWPVENTDDVVLGSSDNFLDKLPFFWVTENMFPSGRKLLFLQSLVLAISGFTLYYFSALYFLRKLKIELTFKNLLPFGWLASMGFAFAELYLNPIWRGFEMGLYVALTTLVAMYIEGDIRPLKTIFGKFLTTLTAGLVGLLIFSDPFILSILLSSASRNSSALGGP